MRKLNGHMTAVIGMIVLLAGAGALTAETPVLTLDELDDDGKTTPLGEKPLAIVDINSEIRIRLNLTALETKVAQLLGDYAVSNALIDRATVLQNTSRKGLELIEPLTQALARWAESAKDQNDVIMLSEELKKSAHPIGDIIGIAKDDPELRSRLNAALAAVSRGAPRAAQNRALFEAAADYAGQLRKTIDEALQKEGAYVQLGAWIVQDGQDRSLHLRGFDQYPEGDFFVVDRWTLLPLSEDQKQQLKDLEKAAKTINDKGVKGLLDINNAAHVAITDFMTQAQVCLDDIEKELVSLQAAVKEKAESLRTLVEEVEREQRRYKNYVVFLKDKYAGESAVSFSSGAALLESTHGDLIQFQQRTRSFVDSERRLINNLRANVVASAPELKEALGTTLDRVEQIVQECKQKVLDAVAAFTGGFPAVVKGIHSAQEINTAVLEFGEEVLKLTLDKVPQSTELNLKRAGMRKAKDVVILKLAAGSAKRQRQILEERRLDLYRVLTHIEMSIGMIFADPTGTTGVQNRFQAGPSYSILFKGFGNREANYNRLLTPGFGLNVAALDFDKDDTPELGIAVVGSAFRDYLQVGYGYNVNEDVGYWFFGLRLPLPTFTLPSDQSPSLP